MAGMDRKEAETRGRIETAQAAANMYGERILGEKPDRKITKMVFTENPPSKVKELHFMKGDRHRFGDRRRYVEDMKAHSKTKLLNAQKTVKDGILEIEESNSVRRIRKKELQGLKKIERHDAEQELAMREVNRPHYVEVMRELGVVKQELNKLKLDMTSVLQSKVYAEKQPEASISRARSYSNSSEAINKEREETNEEEVLVEVARMEAVGGLKVIEAQREADAAQFSTTMEKTRGGVENLSEEINHTKEQEMKQESITVDADVLQRELKLVKSMDRSFQSNTDSLNQLNNPLSATINTKDGKPATASMFESATYELNEAKGELLRIKEEGFKFMASMDVIRNELKHVSDEAARLKKLEEEMDPNVTVLTSKIIRAKAKLASASASEEKARSVVSDLMEALQQLKIEAEEAKKEQEVTREETASIELKVQKIESDIEIGEERLEVAMQELEAVEASEALALKSLRTFTDETIRARAPSTLHSSSVTITDFEYEYLTRRAEEAKEIADKKVAAAMSWTEALKAAEKEILMNIEKAQRGIREKRVMKEREQNETKKALRATKTFEGEPRNWKQTEKQFDNGNFLIDGAIRRKSMKMRSGAMSPRWPKIQRPAPQGVGYVARSSSINLTEKKKTLPSAV